MKSFTRAALSCVTDIFHSHTRCIKNARDGVQERLRECGRQRKEKRESKDTSVNSWSLMEQMRSENNSKSHPKKQRQAKSTNLRHTIINQ